MEEKLILFDKYVEQIKEAKLEYMKKFVGQSYQIILANGELIFLSFTKNILAHLLGIQYPYLKNNLLFKNMDSFAALTFICDKPELVKDEIRKGNLDVELIFSSMVERKTMSIIKTPPLNKNILNKINFTCKYNEHISFKRGNKNPLQSEYLIGIHNDASDMTILGLIKEEESNYFKINSNLLVPNGEKYFSELKNIIGYQTLTYPVSATLYSQELYNSKSQLIYLNEEEKLNKISGLEYYCAKIGTNIDSTADTKRQLNVVVKEKNYRIETLELIKTVLQSIKTSEVIDYEKYKGVDDERIDLLVSVNKMINRLNLAEETLEPILKATSNYEKNYNKLK